MLERCKKPDIYNHKHLYPNTIRTLNNWKVELKLNPYFVRKAEVFNAEQLSLILDLPQSNNELLLDKTYTVWTCFTSMRKEDVHSMRSKNLTVLVILFIKILANFFFRKFHSITYFQGIGEPFYLD
jgi:hypothetical protein